MIPLPEHAFPTVVTTVNGHEIKQNGLTKFEWIVTMLLQSKKVDYIDDTDIATAVAFAEQIVKVCAGK